MLGGMALYLCPNPDWLERAGLRYRDSGSCWNRGICPNLANVYFTAENCVFKVTPAGILMRIAGSTTAPGYAGDGGLATNAVFNRLNGVAVDSIGNVYVADNANSRIRKVTAATGIITTIAGTGVDGFSGDGGPARSAQIGSSVGLTVGAEGDVYLADQFNNRIRKVSAATGIN